MKKFLKILAVLVGVLFLFAVIAIVLLLKNLPSPAEIGQYLKPSTIKTTLKSVDKGGPAKVVLPTKPTAAQTMVPNEGKKDDGNFNLKEDQELMADLMDEKKPLSEVCANLKDASESHLNGYTFKDFGQHYKDSVLTDKKDPLIQSLKPTLRYMFTQTALKDVLVEAQQAEARGEQDGLLEKAGFYAKMVSAYRDILNDKEHLETLMDRSYHLMIMSKVVKQRPELLNDNRLNGYCQDIEAALNGNSKASFEEERAEFNKFMEYSEVDPKTVGYDPNYRTKIDVSFSNKSLKMRGGWVDSMIKPSPEEMKAVQEITK